MKLDRKTWLIVAGCALVGAVAIYLTLFRASDEDKIKKTLSTFASIISAKENDTILSRTARMRDRMHEVVRDDVAVRVDELHVDIRGRQKLEDEAIKIGLVYSDAECTIVNPKIEIDPQATLAQVNAIALVTGKAGGERKVEKRDVHFLLRNDGAWLIDTLDVRPARGDDGPRSP